MKNSDKVKQINPNFTLFGGGANISSYTYNFKSSSTKNRLIIDLIFLSTTSIDLPLIGHVSNCTSDKNI